MILAFRTRTLCWDLVTEEEREQARKRLERGASFESVIEESCRYIGIDEMTVGECEKCGRTHYFTDPEKYPR